MIENQKSLSMAESLEFLKEDKEAGANLKAFKKKFSKVKTPEAKKLRKSIGELELMKVKEEQISSIIDLMPESKEDLNKIFTDVGLDEDEANKILEIVKGA